MYVCMLSHFVSPRVCLVQEDSQDYLERRVRGVQWAPVDQRDPQVCASCIVNIRQERERNQHQFGLTHEHACTKCKFFIHF
jgi:hypothetical protein